METEVLVKFIRHLIACTEAVMEKDEIEAYDVLGLRRELAELKKHIDGKEKLDLRIIDRVLGLELHIDGKLLSDSKTSLGFFALRLIFHRSYVISAQHRRRLEEAKRQLSRFRDDLDQVRFLLSFVESNPTSAPN